MNAAEYRALKKKAAARRAKEVRSKIAAVRLLYFKALRRANRAVARLPRTALSEEGKTAIKEALNRDRLRTDILALISAGKKAVVESTFSVTRDYLASAFKEAGISVDVNVPFDRAEKRIAGNAIVRVPMVFNAKPVTLSDSVWAATDDFSEKILAIVEGELKVGTDPAAISRTLEQYLAGGPEVVKGRWLLLEPDTKEYRQRLGSAGADYRTQRVVRTQLYDAIRESDIQSGVMNPGATGMFTWDLTFASTACDTCAERAAGGPYTAQEIRSLKDDTHPNCSCQCNEVLKDHDQFIAELKAYGRGEEGPTADWAALYGID